MDLTNLVTGVEPEELRDWIVSVHSDRPMAVGSSVPLLGQNWRENNGLWVPEGRSSTVDGVFVYMVLEDYVPGGDLENAASLAEQVISAHPRDDLLTALVHLIHIDTDPRLRVVLNDAFAKALRPDAGATIRTLTRAGPTDGRRLLSPQGIYAAMRMALTAPNQPPTETPPIIAAVLLVHACSTLLREGPATDRYDLMMTLVRNATFNSQQDTAAHVADRAELWTCFGDAAQNDMGSTADELLRTIVGLDATDMLAFGFAIASPGLSYSPNVPLTIDPTLPDISRDSRDIDAALSSISATADEFVEDFGRGTMGPWNFLPFERRPVLRRDDGQLMVLDPKLLLTRITDGLYWDVHEGMRARDGDKGWQAWTRGYGSMVEGFATHHMPSLAPRGVQGAVFYSEDDLAVAYPRSKICDGVIDRGTVFIPIEVVSGRLTVASRIDGQLPAFRRDVQKVLVKKATQLDSSASSLLRDEQRLTGRTPVVGRRVLPVLLASEGFPIVPHSDNFVNEQFKAARLFRDARVQWPGIISLDEFSMLLGLAEHGYALDDSIASWRGKGGPLPLRNHLIATHHDHTLFRRRGVETFWDGLSDQIIDRLGLRT